VVPAGGDTLRKSAVAFSIDVVKIRAVFDWRATFWDGGGASPTVYSKVSEVGVTPKLVPPPLLPTVMVTGRFCTQLFTATRTAPTYTPACKPAGFAVTVKFVTPDPVPLAGFTDSHVLAVVVIVVAM